MVEGIDGPLTTEARVLLARLRSFAFTLGKEGKMQSEIYTDLAATILGKVVHQLEHHDRITAVSNAEVDKRFSAHGNQT